MKRLDIDVVPSISERSLYQTSGLRKLVTFENNTGVPIHVTETSGGSFILNASKNPADEHGVIVYVTYQSYGRCANLNGFAELMPGKQFSRFCDQLKEKGEVTLEYAVNDVGALLRGDLVVLKQLGFAFSTTPIRLDSKPPTMRPGGERTEFTLGVVVVQRYDEPDNYRWLRFYGTKMKIEPITSRYYDPGVYMIIGGGTRVEGSRMIHFEFDDITSPFRLFKDEASADAFRWQEAVPGLYEIKQRLEEQYKEKLESLDSAKDKLELEHKKQLQSMALEKERLTLAFKQQELEAKSRAEARKEFYEMRSYIRKDGSDLFKSVPAYLAAGVAFIGMLT